MQIASILSDLTSLRVCDHSAALALVSVHKNSPSNSSSSPSPNTLLKASSNPNEQDENDVDLQRARDLVELHYGMKVKYQGAGGVDKELEEGRRGVHRAVREMSDGKQRQGRR